MSEDTTIVKKFINSVQNHPILAYLVIGGFVIISVASFTDSIDKLVTLIKKCVSTTSKVTPPLRDSQIANSSTHDNKLIKSEAQIELAKEATLTSKKSQHIISNGKPSDAHPVPIGETTQVAKDKQRPISRSSTGKELPTGLAKERQTTSQNKELSPSIDNSRPEPKPDKDAVEVRPSVKVALASLQGETLSSRVQSLGALMPSLPNDLNAREIASLAGSETLITRQNILKLLVKRAKPRSLNPDDVPLIIGSEILLSRINCINIIAPFIKGPINGKQVIAILSLETHSSRVECLRPIAQLLLQPLSESDIQGILKGTEFSNKTEAIKLIFSEKNWDSGDTILNY